MTLDEFAETTRRIIRDYGFEEYLPSACYPVRREIKVLTGLPPDVEVEQAVLGWASESIRENEEYLVGFKVDESHFKIIRRVGPFSEDEIYAVP
jgi:hypothetical protein